MPSLTATAGRNDPGIFMVYGVIQRPTPGPAMRGLILKPAVDTQGDRFTSTAPWSTPQSCAIPRIESFEGSVLIQDVTRHEYLPKFYRKPKHAGPAL